MLCYHKKSHNCFWGTIHLDTLTQSNFVSPKYSPYFHNQVHFLWSSSSWVLEAVSVSGCLRMLGVWPGGPERLEGGWLKGCLDGWWSVGDGVDWVRAGYLTWTSRTAGGWWVCWWVAGWLVVSGLGYWVSGLHFQDGWRVSGWMAGQWGLTFSASTLPQESHSSACCLAMLVFRLSPETREEICRPRLHIFPFPSDRKKDVLLNCFGRVYTVLESAHVWWWWWRW